MREYDSQDDDMGFAKRDPADFWKDQVARSPEGLFSPNYRHFDSEEAAFQHLAEEYEKSAEAMKKLGDLLAKNIIDDKYKNPDQLNLTPEDQKLLAGMKIKI